MLCCGYILTDFPISIRLTSLALWQSNDCPSASKATLMNMNKYFMWIHYERLHNHNKAKHNKTVCIFLGIYYSYDFVVFCYGLILFFFHILQNFLPGAEEIVLADIIITTNTSAYLMYNSAKMKLRVFFQVHGVFVGLPTQSTPGIPFMVVCKQRWLVATPKGRLDGGCI